MGNTTHPRKAHYFAYQLNSKTKSTLAIYQCLAAPSYFVHLEVWIQTILTPWKTCFTSKAKTSSLVKIGSNALQQRFWMPFIKGRM
jgi:hypothetical protein